LGGGDSETFVVRLLFTWLPGFTFGLVFGSLNLKERAVTLAYASLAAATSALAMYCGEGLTWALVRLVEKDEIVFFPPLFEYAFVHGAVSGALGALLLGSTADLFLDRRQSMTRLFVYLGVGVGLGALVGWLIGAFVGRPAVLYALSSGYAIWQLGVGLLLTWGLSSFSHQAHRLSFEDKVLRFLQGPIVQFLGFLLAVIAFLDTLLRRPN
jgi:hypothetical protein